MWRQLGDLLLGIYMPDFMPMVIEKPVHQPGPLYPTKVIPFNRSYILKRLHI